MVRIKYIKYLLLLFVFTFSVKAQQDLQYSHYVFNPHVINAAITGTREIPTLNLSFRNQWVNFPGAPKTFAASYTMPIMDKKAGWGINAIAEEIGPKQVFNIGSTFAYKIKTGHKTRLSFGLRAGANMFSYRGSEIKFKDFENIAINTDVNKFSPNIDAGVYHYGKKHFIGLGVNHLLNAQLDISKQANKLIILRPHYYLHGAYAFPVNENLTLNPSFLLRYVQSAPPNLDINFNAHINNFFWLGTTYRFNNSMSFLLNINLNSNIRFGYVFDWQYNKIGIHTSNSHEIFLGFDFNSNNKQIHNPRYL
jgi:type IX secretion system PorP/SprF family membrane protein